MRRPRPAEVLEFVFDFSLFVLRFCGFWPYYKDSASRRYRTNWLLRCYSPVVLAVGLCLFYVSSNRIIQQAVFLFHTDSAVLVFQFNRLVSFVAFSSQYVLHHRWFGSIERELRCATRLLRDICTRLPTHPATGYGRLLFVFVLRTCVFAAVMVALDMTMLYRLTPLVRAQPWLVLVIELAAVLNGMAANVHGAAMMAAGNLFARLNEETAAIAAAAARIAEPQAAGGDAFRRMRRFCELSDRLDRVAELHERLVRLTQRFHRMWSASMAIYVLYRGMDALMRAFVTFLLGVQWELLVLLSGGDADFPLVAMGFDAMLVVLDCVDSLMVAWTCSEAERQVSFERVSISNSQCVYSCAYMNMLHFT